MREVCGNRETCSPGLHTWRGYWEEVGTWGKMDEKERWMKKVKDSDGDYVVDLVETFFADLDLR